MDAGVRSVNTTPVPEDFAGSSGTPVVVDRETGIGYVLKNDETVQPFGTGVGNVTSVGLSAPSILDVSGSPITTSGTLALSLATQLANRTFSGPTGGGDATPTFRALVAADIPTLLSTKISDFDEAAQDAVGGILADTATVDLTYNDGVPSISAITIQQMSIDADASGLKLSGDAASPGNEKYYGTDSGGVKGFHDLPEVTAQAIAALGYWAPVSNGDPDSPELIFDSYANVVVAFTVTP
jgi:hypothetical protein